MQIMSRCRFEFSSFGREPILNPPRALSIHARARNDEEVRENIVEQVFRIGWPSLSPLPTEFTRCKNAEERSSFVANPADALQRFRNILASESVDVFLLELGWQRTRGSKEGEHRVLRVVASDKISGGSWYNAVVRLARSLEVLKVGGDQIHIEVIERGFPRLYPVKSEDPILDLWSTEIAPMVLEQLRLAAISWQSLILVYLGSISTVGEFPTMVIEADDVTDLAWDSICVELQSAIGRAQCNLAIWQREKIHGTGHSTDSNLFQRMWTANLFPGDGIAPEGVSNGTGTVGGVVTLQPSDGRSKDYILTNFHVVNTKSLTEVLQPVPLKSICFPRGHTAYPMKIPADMDTQAIISRERGPYEGLLGDVNFREKGAPSLAERAEWGDTLAKRRVAECEDAKEKFEVLRLEIEEHAKCPYGHLRATSGYSHLKVQNLRLALDWALIEVDQRRDLRKTCPHANVLFQSGLSRPQWVRNEEQKWTSRHDLPETVVKVGRMTGWTQGIPNRAEAYWKPLERNDYEVSDWEDNFGVVVNFIQILGTSEDDTRDILGVFAAAGDSGSVVRDLKTGAWVGLLLGAHRVGWGLMAPIEAVLMSIEDVTGEKVINPTQLE
ncbi:hypothetical protein IWX47DRAFT_941832 [Phyllosticta citricarpa]|uniref:Uncharacterized protein n=2 Tax=Phyllosticta TaxID=121621 RepID=A0ABR1MNW4_9PEZI